MRCVTWSVDSEALCLGIMNLVTCATRDLKINRNLAALLHKMQEQQVSNSCHLAVTQHLQLQLVVDDACVFSAGNEGHVRADGGKHLGRHSKIVTRMERRDSPGKTQNETERRLRTEGKTLQGAKV